MKGCEHRATIRRDEYDLNGFDSNFLIESFPFLFKNMISGVGSIFPRMVCYFIIFEYFDVHGTLSFQFSNFLIVECSSFLKNIIFGK